MPEPVCQLPGDLRDHVARHAHDQHDRAERERQTRRRGGVLLFRVGVSVSVSSVSTASHIGSCRTAVGWR